MTRSRCAHDYTLNLEEWVGHQQRAAILTHRRQAFYNLAYFFHGFQLPSMPMMPFSSPFFLPTQLRLGIVPLLRRVARGWFGRVSRILVHPLLQFVHLFFQRLDILPKLNDDRLHEAGVFSQSSGVIGTSGGQFIVTVYILSPSFPTAYHYPFSDSLILVRLRFLPTERI